MDQAEETKQFIQHQAEAAGDDFDRSNTTRNFSLAGVGLSWLTALGCITAGAALLNRAAESATGHLTVVNDSYASYNTDGWLHISMSQIQRQFTFLALDITIAILTDSIGLVHSTTLRWALKDRLTFNANLRLFIVAPDSWAFDRISNFFGAGFLAVCYCASSLKFADTARYNYIPTMTEKVIIDDESDVNVGSVYLSPSAILALGIGLMGAAAISTWQYASISVPTWSTSPIENARAFVSTGQRSKSEGCCLMASHKTRSEGHSALPRIEQRSAWSTCREIRRVLVYLWILAALSLASFISVPVTVRVLTSKCDPDVSLVTIGCVTWWGESWSLLPDTNGLTSLLKLVFINDLINYAPTSWKPTDAVATGMAPAFILILVIQSFVTIGLHCAELVVNMSRDESTWRETNTEHGYKARDSVLTVLTSPKSLILQVFKPLTHWLFGLAITVYYNAGIFIRPPTVFILIPMSADLGDVRHLLVP